jgi:hypothetical protein
MGLLTFLFGDRKATTVRPAAPIPLDALEEIKDRILAACETRSDWDQRERARIAAKAKEVFYMTLAARDLLRASRLESNDVTNIGILLDRTDAARADLVASLDALDADARDLRRDLEKALQPCSEAIRQRLPRQAG